MSEFTLKVATLKVYMLISIEMENEYFTLYKK